MDETQNNSEENQAEYAQVVALVADLRQKAFLQIIFGLLWWLGSAIAMYIALASTGDTYYWYGGALGSLFHWYRAFKLIRATQQVGAKSLVQRELVLIGFTAFVVFFTSYTIVPEYFRTTTPSVGTCWFTSSDTKVAPVACWSSRAEFKTVAYEDSEENCQTDLFLKPNSDETQYACLAEMS